jgi:hypothetical protein
VVQPAAPRIDPLEVGEEGVVWPVCAIRFLPDTSASLPTVKYAKRKDG